MTIAITRGPVIIAADGLSQTDIMKLGHVLRELKLRAFKYNDALDDPGPQIMRWVEGETGVPSFADAKLCDIPATVGNRVQKLVKAGASIITVKADCQVAGIAAAVKGAEGQADIYVVGVLTSMTEQQCRTLYGRTVAEQQELFFTMAREADAHGLICSPMDLRLAMEIGWTGHIATPGVRSPGAEAHDQVRIDTPKAAIDGGATSIVVGRQVVQSGDPAGALKRVYEEIGFDWTA